MLNRLLPLLVYLALVLADVPGHGLSTAQNRVGNFFESHATAPPENPAQAVQAHQENGAAYGETASGRCQWYLTDRLGSVTGITDATGALINSNQYDSYGHILSQSNPAVADQLAFTGREFDAETGLYYFRARYYNPDLGRFQSEDPIGDKIRAAVQIQGSNPFATLLATVSKGRSSIPTSRILFTPFAAGDFNLGRYASNAPTGYIDPYGTISAGPGNTEYKLIVTTIAGESVDAGLAFIDVVEITEVTELSELAQGGRILGTAGPFDQEALVEALNVARAELGQLGRVLIEFRTKIY